MSAPARLRAAIAAAVILAIGMGFGRFAFTAIYERRLGAESRRALAAWTVWTMRGTWREAHFAEDFKRCLEVLGR